MALKLTLIGPKGQTVSYHRILIASQSFIKGQEGIYVNLGGYASEVFREVEKEKGEDMVLNNTPVFLPFIEGDTDFSREHLYSRIKLEVPEFNSAEDC